MHGYGALERYQIQSLESLEVYTYFLIFALFE